MHFDCQATDPAQAAADAAAAAKCSAPQDVFEPRCPTVPHSCSQIWVVRAALHVCLRSHDSSFALLLHLLHPFRLFFQIWTLVSHVFALVYHVAPAWIRCRRKSLLLQLHDE